MEITDNIYSLAQQIFQLIQHQEMEITINQQTIQYKSTARIPQHKVQKKLKNVVDKIMTKVKVAMKKQQIVGLYQELIKETWTWWMQQFPKNYYQPEILLNTAMDTIMSNQLEKMTNAQFEELQIQITQVILEKEVQEIIQEKELKELDFDRA
ncbi:hypothetical protein G9A89_003847 [Geosiphon pyriformis]|nr:hypothetical protein G9A89_003847 [Geosiphon pyriformis]